MLVEASFRHGRDPPFSPLPKASALRQSSKRFAPTLRDPSPSVSPHPCLRPPSPVSAAPAAAPEHAKEDATSFILLTEVVREQEKEDEVLCQSHEEADGTSQRTTPSTTPPSSQRRCFTPLVPSAKLSGSSSVVISSPTPSEASPSIPRFSQLVPSPSPFCPSSSSSFRRPAKKLPSSFCSSCSSSSASCSSCSCSSEPSPHEPPLLASPASAMSSLPQSPSPSPSAKLANHPPSFLSSFSVNKSAPPLPLRKVGVSAKPGAAPLLEVIETPVQLYPFTLSFIQKLPPHQREAYLSSLASLWGKAVAELPSEFKKEEADEEKPELQQERHQHLELHTRFAQHALSWSVAVAEHVKAQKRSFQPTSAFTASSSPCRYAPRSLFRTTPTQPNPTAHKPAVLAGTFF